MLNYCFLSTVLLFLLSGCGYQLAVMQGIPDDKLSFASVTFGTTRSDVYHLLGSPNITDPFHEDCEGYFYKYSTTHTQRFLWVCFDENDKVDSVYSSD
ncbi:outer membrane protein assembly factor BamE [Candidatus Ichthyocystis sparus]|uniref:outer membrane protein assembly factor BamE n=1 Tax=Candidatus Ichthyocystis sparus TaxID=1561004 RepID=UPI000B83BE97|nr:outer membrane protein assembly factor BamE [Candidatus Ichthyocystis sparus]